jgi:hypothetical protein
MIKILNMIKTLLLASTFAAVMSKVTPFSPYDFKKEVGKSLPAVYANFGLIPYGTSVVSIV